MGKAKDESPRQSRKPWSQQLVSQEAWDVLVELEAQGFIHEMFWPSGSCGLFPKRDSGGALIGTKEVG